MSRDRLVREIVQVRSRLVNDIMNQLFSGADTEQSISSLARVLMEGLPTNDWVGLVGYQNLVFKGVYSPVQLLLSYCSRRERAKPDRDYPFLFGTLGSLFSLLTGTEYRLSNTDAEKYRKTLQTIFQLREMREESENLSIETYIPDSINENGRSHYQDLNLKKLGQIFGRGTGVVTTDKFPKRIEVKGNVFDIFREPDGTPTSLLYTLGQVYSHVPTKSVSVALRRDRLVTVSTQNNPLLEFYDGGWHIVDLASGRAALEECFRLYPDIASDALKSDISRPLMFLAYYMATHWHSGILAVIDYEKAKADNVLERQTTWSKRSNDIIKNNLKNDGFSEQLMITDLKDTHYGRVLLTAAIQDGATIFCPDGRFHSSGRVVTGLRSGSNPDLGTGNRAARTLSKYGIALKISEDGGIRLYSSKPEKNDILNKGLRIR